MFALSKTSRQCSKLSQNVIKSISLIDSLSDRKFAAAPNRRILGMPGYCDSKHFSVGSSSSEESKRIVKMALAGNMAITFAKAACWLSTGSSGMLSETVHSLVDSGNQALLLIGLSRAESAADQRHPYGYGKSVYFWSLVSALGTFWFGAGISGWNSLKDILNPALELHNIGWEVWAVLGVSFSVDGYVLTQTLRSLMKKKPPGVSLYRYCLSLRDPTTAAVFLEDSAACLGVLVAGTGIAVTQLSGMIIWDSLAGLTVAGVMGFMGLYLARMNQRFLLGQAVDSDINNKIREIIMARQSVEGMHSVQSQWIGANSFAYKAEVEIDGTYLAAKLLNRYQKEFVNYINRREPGNVGTKKVELVTATAARSGAGSAVTDISSGDRANKSQPLLHREQTSVASVTATTAQVTAAAAAAAIDEDEIRLLLSWYAEDVMRVVEQEVKEIEEAIRAEFPEAQYIEIEPDSSQYESGEMPGLEGDVDQVAGSKTAKLRKVFRYAIDDGRKMPSSRRLEIDTIKRMHHELNVRSGLPPAL